MDSTYHAPMDSGNNQQTEQVSVPLTAVGDGTAFDQAQRAGHTLVDTLKSNPAMSTSIIQSVLQNEQALGNLALLYVEARGEFEAMMLEVRQAGAKTKEVDALQKSVNSHRRNNPKANLRVVEPGELPRIFTVKELVPDAPVSDSAIVPPGWSLDRTAGIVKSLGSAPPIWVPVSPSPIIITGRMKDVADGSESVRLAWIRDDRWQQHTTDREVVANKQTIVSLASVGLPVTSGTAADLVKYLSEYEASNISHLPKAHVSSHMGWQGDDGSQGFLWGRTLIRPDGSHAADVDLEALSPEDWQEGTG